MKEGKAINTKMEALVELHDNIMYYLVAILFSVAWIQGAIIKNFDNYFYFKN